MIAVILLHSVAGARLIVESAAEDGEYEVHSLE